MGLGARFQAVEAGISLPKPNGDMQVPYEDAATSFVKALNAKRKIPNPVSWSPDP